MLERYPYWTDWKQVCWSDECYWGWGPYGTLRIIRKPGIRRCADCVQQEREPKEKDMKRLYTWSAVGWEFKGDLIFYDAGNSNGKMSQRVYIDQILDPVVKEWLKGPRFVLEEDGDSGHGTSMYNIVRTWKKEHKLESYFNCSNSPDLSIIENCWQAPKQALYKTPHWDDITTKEVIIEAWNSIPQSFIDNSIKTIPDRYKAIIKGDGQMTAY
ncbi:hmg box protein [Rutstroemia sp. NJR-2017a WRK4]|nr:hmg box protein [Rutstroemia sp. NJR-2017a WRK4]